MGSKGNKMIFFWRYGNFSALLKINHSWALVGSKGNKMIMIYFIIFSALWQFFGPVENKSFLGSGFWRKGPDRL